MSARKFFFCVLGAAVAALGVAVSPAQSDSGSPSRSASSTFTVYSSSPGTAGTAAVEVESSSADTLGPPLFSSSLPAVKDSDSGVSNITPSVGPDRPVAIRSHKRPRFTGDPDQPVPEPASLLLLGSGLTGLATLRRRWSFKHRS